MKTPQSKSACQPAGYFSPDLSRLRYNPSILRSKLRSKLEQFWQSIIGVSMVRPGLQVWHTCDQGGNIWWNGYDPSTGSAIRGVCEAEIRRWVEQRYQ